MFGLTYLPKKDLDRQQELQDELFRCRDMDRVDKIREEIRELESKRKPVIECNIEECAELKNLLHSKLEAVAKIGKRQQMATFQRMIKMLDERMLILNLEMAREQKEKAEKFKEQKEERKHHAEEVSRTRSEESDGPSRRRSGKSSWSTSIGKIH